MEVDQKLQRDNLQKLRRREPEGASVVIGTWVAAVTLAVAGQTCQVPCKLKLIVEAQTCTRRSIAGEIKPGAVGNDCARGQLIRLFFKPGLCTTYCKVRSQTLSGGY